MFVEVEITFISNTTLKDINRLSSMCGIVCSFLFVLLIRLQFYNLYFFLGLKNLQYTVLGNPFLLARGLKP